VTLVLLEVKVIYICFPRRCFHKDYNVWGPHFHPFTLSKFYFLMELDVDNLSNE